MDHEVDLLLSCGCIMFERIEAVIFLPQPGENRQCIKHKRTVTISKVGQPYWVNDEPKEDQVTTKKNQKG